MIHPFAHANSAAYLLLCLKFPELFIAIISHRKDGAPERTRTPNLLIRSQMLYPLSYGRVMVADVCLP